MNRRGFLWAVGAAGLAMLWRGPVVAGEASAGTAEPPTSREGERMTPAEITTLLQHALRERRTVRFRYHDMAREVEPHALGVTSGEERAALLAWQFAGGSESEPPPGWRTFFVGEIERVVVTGDTFAVRASYDPKKTKFKTITHEVARE